MGPEHAAAPGHRSQRVSYTRLVQPEFDEFHPPNFWDGSGRTISHEASLYSRASEARSARQIVVSSLFATPDGSDVQDFSVANLMNLNCIQSTAGLQRLL